MSFILALDQGTTSSRAILFDHDGNPVGIAQQEFPQFFPQPGWVEHDPEGIWSSQLAVARRVLRDCGVSSQEIAAIGIANQRETVVVWDRTTGKPVSPAIVWQDRRTSDICQKLATAGLGPQIQSKTGLLLDPYFSATKIQWILKHVRGTAAKARAGKLLCGTIDSWLVWRLTEGRSHVTEGGNASRTMLCNLQTADWDNSLLELFSVPRAMLPEIRPSSGDFGQTKLLGGTIPITGIAGDQQAALFGQACHKPGMVKNTYGTGCFMLMHTGTKPVRSRHRLLTTIAWQLEGETHYALEGSIFVAGAVVQWLRDGLGLIRQAADIEKLAGSVPDSHGVIFVPAFAGLGAPHWNSAARGTMMGLTRGVTSAHIARAALEGIALQVADVLTAMENEGGVPLKELRVDGGAAANKLLMQIQADLIGVPVVRPQTLETTALGAAYLAGLAVGFWKSPREIAAHWREERRFLPKMKAKQRDQIRARWAQGIERAKDWEL